MQVQDGQCGLCNHFGESHQASSAMVTIITSHEAEPSVLDECGHPRLSALHLKVTPISGCDGFEPAEIH